MATVFQKCKEDEKNKNYPCEKTRCGHSWTVRYREPGGRTGRQREKSFPTFKKADDYGIKMENDKRAGVYLDPERGKMTVRVWAHQWLDSQILKPNTLRDYKGFIENYLIPTLGRKTLAGVTAQDIATLVAAMSKGGLKASTIKTRTIPLRSMFNAAVADKRIAVSPCTGMAVPRQASAGVDRDDIPNRADVDAIAAGMPAPYRLVVWLIAGAGLRPSEAFAVSEDCPRGDVLKVYRQTSDHETDGPRKGLVPLKYREEGDYRETPVAPFLAEAIAEHTDAHGTHTVDGVSGLFFASKAGNLLTHEGFYYHWRRVTKKLGMTYTPHSLRHFFASTALAGGISLLEVSRWLGHRSIKVTADIYGHLMGDASERMRAVMQAAVRPTLTVVNGDQDGPTEATPEAA